MGIFDKLFKKKAIESQQSIPVKQDKQEKNYSEYGHAKSGTNSKRTIEKRIRWYI